MSVRYDWDLSRMAVEKLLMLKPNLQFTLVDLFNKIAENPYNLDNDPCFTIEGKRFETWILEQRIITFYIDHSECKLNILAIE